MTSTEANALHGVDRALALDSLDESPIDRLVEDEDGIFTADEAATDWADVPDYFYGIGGF